MMTLQEFKTKYINDLGHLYPKEECLSILQIICEDLLHWSRTDFLIRDREKINHLEEEIILRSLHQLLQSTPVQYITGIAHFYGHTFEVNQHTLIPRQETEELVDLVLREIKSLSCPAMIDLGTGSGCIGLSIKVERKDCAMSLLDISSEALQVARSNASKLAAQVDFFQEDILSCKALPGSYDIIISNPPYVRELEKEEIHDNVLKYEPHSALFVDDNDALVFYRKILKLAQSALRKDGKVFFEINQYLPEQMKQLAESLGFESKLYRDINQNWRMIKCWKA
ncbi:peptide chain release factor N(5)-glutamine methyltransferase [Nonlabens xiamenensis]|uniref:peptide chain release factor N(5)-glutamine methyltransferase n=1 Tax=Nonlabens xiamenensis TaxID=2341043 RepID=UPI001F0BE5CA|nr:peptide chain release factor N(5)-glutamine methyltransferase [Nonlabens xiamenensis]